MIEYESAIDFFSCKDVGNGIYFYGRDSVGLCRYDLELNMLEKNILNEEMGDGLHFFDYTDCICLKNKLYFAPYLVDKMCIFDLSDGNYEHVNVGFVPLSRKIVESGSYLYFICQSNKILKYDRVSGKLDVIEIREEGNIYKDACIYKGKLYYPLKTPGCIVEYDLKTNTTKKKRITDREITFATICRVGEFFWLTGNRSFASKWKPESGEVLYIDFPTEEVKRDFPWDTYFSASILYENEVYLAPLRSDWVMAINTDSEDIRQVVKIPEGSLSWNIQAIKGKICVSLQDISNKPVKNMLFDINGEIQSSNYINLKYDLNEFIKKNLV